MLHGGPIHLILQSAVADNAHIAQTHLTDAQRNWQTTAMVPKCIDVGRHVQSRFDADLIAEQNVSSAIGIHVQHENQSVGCRYCQSDVKANFDVQVCPLVEIL